MLARIEFRTLRYTSDVENGECQSEEENREVLLSRFEVTRSEYYGVISREGLPDDDNLSGEHPMSEITIGESKWFLNLLSRAAGLTVCYESSGLRALIKSCNGYRLPTVDEWLEANRDRGDVRIVPIGSVREEHGDGETRRSFSWLSENSGGQPHPIGYRRPNQQGYFDMFGNVAELVENENETYRFGGSYRESPEDIDRFQIETSVAAENRDLTEYELSEGPCEQISDDIGFRIARTVREECR